MANGTLPAGKYEMTIAEFETKFAYNITRKGLFNKLIKLIEDLKNIGCQTLYIDGSYVTNKVFPGDMDICWEMDGVDLAKAKPMLPALFDRSLQKSVYGADIFPANIMERNSMKLFIDFFQTDKNTGQPKGIVKIKII